MIIMNLNEQLRNYLLQKGFQIWVENIDPSDPNFPKLRAKGFGASDSAALLDVSPFTTREQLLQEKKYEQFDDDISKKANVRKGKDLEPLLIQKIETIIQTKVIKPTDMYGDDRTGLSVNFDGVTLEHNQFIPHEIKVCTPYGRRYYTWTKSIMEYDYELRTFPQKDRGPAQLQSIHQLADYYGIPIYYFTQLQQQMYFLDAPYGYLDVMDDQNWCLHIFKVYRHQHVIDQLLKEAQDAYLILKAFRNELKEQA